MNEWILSFVLSCMVMASIFVGAALIHLASSICEKYPKTTITVLSIFNMFVLCTWIHSSLPIK